MKATTKEAGTTTWTALSRWTSDLSPRPDSAGRIVGRVKLGNVRVDTAAEGGLINSIRSGFFLSLPRHRHGQLLHRRRDLRFNLCRRRRRREFRFRSLCLCDFRLRRRLRRHGHGLISLDRTAADALEVGCEQDGMGPSGFGTPQVPEMVGHSLVLSFRQRLLTRLCELVVALCNLPDW